MAEGLDRDSEERAVTFGWPSLSPTLYNASLSIQLEPVNPSLRISPGHVLGTKPYFSEKVVTKAAQPVSATQQLCCCWSSADSALSSREEGFGLFHWTPGIQFFSPFSTVVLPSSGTATYHLVTDFPAAKYLPTCLGRPDPSCMPSPLPPPSFHINSHDNPLLYTFRVTLCLSFTV